MSQNQDNGIWMIMMIAIILGAAVVSLLSSGQNQTQPAGYSPSSPTSAEKRYVENRFRQEGYSAAESAQAAEAVLKFHQAQQNRR